MSQEIVDSFDYLIKFQIMYYRIKIKTSLFLIIGVFLVLQNRLNTNLINHFIIK
jgi:hypothetical protein